jgi:acyl carrier protein
MTSSEPDVAAVVCGVVQAAFWREAGRKIEIVPALDFRRELDIDSIALLGLIFALEERLGVDLMQHAERLADATLVSHLIDVARDAMLQRRAA